MRRRNNRFSGYNAVRVGEKFGGAALTKAADHDKATAGAQAEMSFRQNITRVVDAIKRQDAFIMRDVQFNPTKVEFVSNVLDTRTWQNMLASNEDLTQRFGDSEAMLAHGCDLFLSLNRPALALSAKPVNGEWRKLLAAAMATPEWAQLRASTLTDDKLSAYAAYKFWEHLKSLDPDMTNGIEQQGAAEQKSAKADELDKTADEMASSDEGDEGEGDAGEDAGESGRGKGKGESGEDGDAGAGEGGSETGTGKAKGSTGKASNADGKAKAERVEQMRAAAEELRREAEALQAEAEQSFEDAKPFDATGAELANNVLTDVTDLADVAQGFGCEAGELTPLAINPETRSLFDSKSLRKFLDLAGRLEHVIGATVANKPAAHPDQVDIVTGNDIRNVLPCELAMMDEPDLELIFLQRYADAQLLQYHRETNKLGKGPFIICLDQSGSMDGVQYEWASAFAWAIAKQAKAQQRKFGLVCFSSENQKHQVFAPRPVEFLSHLSQFYGGGTDFTTPLNAALKMLSDKERNADIVFVTDGESYVSPYFVETFRKRTRDVGCRVLTVLIGKGVRDESVRGFSDSVFRIEVSPRDGTCGTGDAIKALVTKMA